MFFNYLIAQVVVPEASSQAISYYTSGNMLWILQWIWTLTIPLLFIVTGLSVKLGRFADKYGKSRFFSYFIYLVVFVILYQLLNLPLDFYASYIRENQYGLSTQTIARWLGNFGKWTMVIMLASLTFTWCFYLLLKKSPQRWWIYSSLMGIGITIIMTFIYPIWIDPLFNDIGPLKDKQLEKSILELAARAGIENGRVFEVDKSKDTTMVNAYVAGLGSTERIVIWDTTIKANSKDAILFIMGHEMGHYVLRHGWLLMGYLSILYFAIAYLTYRVTNYLLQRYQLQLGFQDLHDFASLPLFLFLVSFFILVSTPFYNYFSRYTEREADRFGIEITKNNEVAAQLFAGATHEHLMNPRPGNIYKIWRCSHPPLGERIDFCNSYCPWKTNQSLKYAAYFKEVEKIE